MRNTPRPGLEKVSDWMDAKERKRRKQREGVISSPLNAGAEYMNTASRYNQGEEIECVIAV